MSEIKCDKCKVKKCDTRDAIKKHPEMRIIIGHIIEGCNEYKKSIWLCDGCFVGDEESYSKSGWCNNGGLPFKSLDYPINKCEGFKPKKHFDEKKKWNFVYKSDSIGLSQIISDVRKEQKQKDIDDFLNTFDEFWKKIISLQYYDDFFDRLKPVYKEFKERIKQRREQ